MPRLLDFVKRKGDIHGKAYCHVEAERNLRQETGIGRDQNGAGRTDGQNPRHAAASGESLLTRVPTTWCWRRNLTQRRIRMPIRSTRSTLNAKKLSTAISLTALSQISKSDLAENRAGSKNQPDALFERPADFVLQKVVRLTGALPPCIRRRNGNRGSGASDFEGYGPPRPRRDIGGRHTRSYSSS